MTEGQEIVLRRWLDGASKSKIEGERLAANEIMRLRQVIEDLDETSRYFSERCHTPIRVIRRDFHEETGVLLAFSTELKDIIVGCESVRGGYGEPKVKETKTTRIPKSSMLYFEFILESIKIPDEPEKNGEGVGIPPQ